MVSCRSGPRTFVFGGLKRQGDKNIANEQKRSLEGLLHIKNISNCLVIWQSSSVILLDVIMRLVATFSCKILLQSIDTC